MSKGRLAARMLASIVAMIAVTGALLFLPAGTWRYWQAWAFGAVFLIPSLIISLYFLARDPAFIARRMRTRERERRQQVGQSILGLLFVGGMVIAGLDHRYGWSAVPVPLVIAADAVVLAGFLLVFYVFQVNRYAASTVQVEAGQQVISTGPYAVVRHPMYTGALLMFLSIPPALGSYWAWLAYLPMIIGLALRALNEEEVLSRDLPNYDEYRRKVRWRLVPGVW